MGTSQWGTFPNGEAATTGHKFWEAEICGICLN